MIGRGACRSWRLPKQSTMQGDDRAQRDMTYVSPNPAVSLDVGFSVECRYEAEMHGSVDTADVAGSSRRGLERPRDRHYNGSFSIKRGPINYLGETSLIHESITAATVHIQQCLYIHSTSFPQIDRSGSLKLSTRYLTPFTIYH